MNKAQIIGNLGQDPEVRYAQSGMAIVTMSVATTSRYKTATGDLKEETEWHRVKAFGKLAEICQKYLAKGSKVYCEGRIKTEKYTDKSGIDRYSTSIVLSEMEMLDGKKTEKSDAESPTQKFMHPPAGADAGSKHASSQENFFDDDPIPF